MFVSMLRACGIRHCKTHIKMDLLREELKLTKRRLEESLLLV